MCLCPGHYRLHLWDGSREVSKVQEGLTRNRYNPTASGLEAQATAEFCGLSNDAVLEWSSQQYKSHEDA
jgi:hypothetical protein